MGSPTQIMIATPGTRGRGARGLRLVENFKIGISSMDPWQGWAPCPPRQATYLAQRIGYPAEPTHPPHAIGTQGPGPLGDQITSREASFVFHPRNPRVKLNARMLGPPSPVGRTKGSLFEPHWHSQNRPRTSG